MSYSVKRADQGILDQWSVMQGPVRVAIVAESAPEPILLRGSLEGLSLAVVERLIANAKAVEEMKRSRLRGGIA